MTPPKKLKESWSLQALSLLENHTAREVCALLNLKETTFNYHLQKWKRLDVIVKKGYGVWEVNQAKRHLVLSKPKRVKKAGKQLRKTTPCRSSGKGGCRNEKFVVVHRENKSFKVEQDSVATHGLLFVLSLPSLARWNKWGRKEYLKSRNIEFNIISQGEQLEVFGWRVWLTNKTVVAYAPKGKRWYGSTARDGFSEAFFEFLRVVQKLERMLGVSLTMAGRYKVRTRREHHALIGNALADQYNRAGEKLYLRDERGLWGLIDASFLAEFETVRAGKDGRDANEKVQDFFNGVKATGVTPQFLLEQDARIQDKLERYAENIDTHVQVMKEIRDFIKEFRELKK